MIQVTLSKTDRNTMGQNHVYISLGLFFLLLQSSPVKPNIPTLNFCHEETATSDHVDLNMNTSLIAGQDGSCSCRVSFTASTELVVSVHNLTSPHCTTSVSTVNYNLNFTCIDGYIQHPVYNTSFANGSGFWINVKTNGISAEPMSGFIQLRTQRSTNFSLHCFEPITTRTTRTTPLPTSRTTTGKTTTTTTTGKSTTTSATTADRMISSSTMKIPAQSMPTTTVGRTESAKLNTTPSDSKEELPVSAIAGSIVCVVGVVIIIIAGVVFHRRYKCIRRPAKGPLTPESRDHPTYSDLTNRENTRYLSINLPAESAATSESEAHPTYCDYINRENTVYEQIDQSKSDNVYKNIPFA